VPIASLLPSSRDVAEVLRKSHRVSRLVGAVWALGRICLSKCVLAIGSSPVERLYVNAAIAPPSGTARSSYPLRLFPKDRSIIDSYEFSCSWLRGIRSARQFRLASYDEWFSETLPDLDESKRLSLIQKSMNAPVLEKFGITWTLYLSNTMPLSDTIDLLPLIFSDTDNQGSTQEDSKNT
jgi:hypothetical protein